MSEKIVQLNEEVIKGQLVTVKPPRAWTGMRQ